MKILKRLMPLAVVAVASTAEADFLEAIQMSPKARSQIEFVDMQSMHGATLAGTYKTKEDGVFTALSGSNKSIAIELGPYWKKGGMYVMATGRFEQPLEGAPSVKGNFRVTKFYGHENLLSMDGGLFYDAKVSGTDTLSGRATAGVKLPLSKEAGSLRAGIEDTFVSGKAPRPYFIARYDRGKWSVVGEYGNGQGIVKVRRDFYKR